MNEAVLAFQVTQEGDLLRFLAMDNLVAKHVPGQRAFLQEAIKGAQAGVILDLSQVQMMDSLGITLLVRIYKTCQERRLTFRVEGANAEILRLAKFFSLSDLFQMQGS
jgi:anti-anti-sigma factor